MSECNQEKEQAEIQAALKRIRRYDNGEPTYLVYPSSGRRDYFNDCEMVAKWFAIQSESKPKLVIHYHRDDNGTLENGPLYNVLLPKYFPIGNGSMAQAAPCQAELKLCSERFPRVAAAYEVAVAIVLKLTSEANNEH